MASWKPTKNFSRKCPDCGASLLVPTWPRCIPCGKKRALKKGRESYHRNKNKLKEI